MVKELFKLNWKENKVWILAFTGILLIYSTISVAMFDPESANTMEALIGLLPEAMVRMFGFENLGTNMTYYVSNYLYGFIILMFPLIFIIITGNKMVSRHVDSGSMIYMVTMPYTRRKIIFNQALFFVLSVLFIILVNVSVVIIMAEIMFSGHLDIGLFLALNFVTIGVMLVTAAIAFFFSCLFSDSSKTLGASGGLLFMFIITHMISGLDEKTEFLRFFTPFTLIDVNHILEGGGNGMLVGTLMYVIAIGIFYASIELFNRKSLII